MPFVNNEVYIISCSKKKTTPTGTLTEKNKLFKHTKKLTNNTKLGSFHHHRWTHQQAIFSLVVLFAWKVTEKVHLGKLIKLNCPDRES